MIKKYAVDFVGKMEPHDIHAAMAALREAVGSDKPLPNSPLPDFCFAELIQDGAFEYRHIRAVSMRDDDTFGKEVSRLDVQCEVLA